MAPMTAQVVVAQVTQREPNGLTGVASQLTTTTTYLDEKSNVSAQTCQTLWLEQEVFASADSGVGNICESPVQAAFGVHLEHINRKPEVVRATAPSTPLLVIHNHCAGIVTEKIAPPANPATSVVVNDNDASDEGDSDDEEDSDDEPDTYGVPEGQVEDPQLPTSRPVPTRVASYNGANGNLQKLLFDEISKTRGGGVGDERMGFIPCRRLEDLINVQNVQEQLLHNESTKAKSVNWLVEVFTSTEGGLKHRDARRICGLPRSSRSHSASLKPPKCYSKIFTILMLIQKPGRISRFVEEEVCDADLPLVKLKRRKPLKPFRLARISNTPKKLKCFKGWKLATIMDFWEKQWCVVVPRFTRCPNTSYLRLLRFEAGTILPFHDGRHIHYSGGADIYETAIHPDHHDFCDEEEKNDARFAVKRLVSEDESVFQREFSVLKRAKHRHLVTLLTAFKRGPTYYLLFPYAPADLREFWQTVQPNPKFGKHGIKWMARQCKGLAGALAKVHRHETSSQSSVITRLEEQASQTPDDNLRPVPSSRRPTSRSSNNSSSGGHILYGRHGDIKPENILWFPGEDNESEQGTLKIADFGISELSTRQNHPSDSVTGLSPTYRPPECDNPGNQVVNSLWDVWSLGCLYLEFATWLLKGWEGIDEFRRLRRAPDTWYPAIKSDVFFESQKGQDGSLAHFLKPAVQQWMQVLHSHESCSDFIHDFLNLIRTDMLVVELPHHAESRAPGRGGVEEVWRKLRRYCKKMDASPDYCITPTPFR